MRLRLKTKLVIAISAMVLALVSVLSYVYLSQLVRQRIAEAYADGDFIAHQIYQVSRDALEADLAKAPIDPADKEALRTYIENSLRNDPGVNSLIQSVVGYSPNIYEVAIADVHGNALLHSVTDLEGQPLPHREPFFKLRKASFWRQMKVVYGKPEVYDVTLPLQRAGVPFGEVRVSLQTLFLKNELEPQFNHALTFAAIAIVVSFLLAAALSNIALHPLEAISARLDRMTAGEIDVPAETAAKPSSGDEYGAVNTKIDKLGRQMRDVKEVFSALKENLDQIMANLQDGLMLFTRDYRAVLISASAERFVGMPRSEMLGKAVEEIFSDATELGHRVLDAFQQHRPLNTVQVETESQRQIELSLDFIEERGERIGALLTIRDAESVQKIEDEIELSRRLAAIGRLTSGVAHEVKNPINAIVLHLEVLNEKLPNMAPDAKRHVDVISNEIRRLDRVVQTLVDFSRPVELRLAETDLRRTLEDVVLLAVPQATELGIKLQRQISPEPLPVRIDADLIKQAVLNVVLNGIQAMSGKSGTLEIHAYRDNGAVTVDIEDQGGGIPTSVRDKIFNLYFTTKKGGSGIGLAMTYRVMQLHNGSVEFTSRDGAGTTFHLRLPLVAPDEPSVAVVTAGIQRR
ncbi:MAG TPA: ATP-binding protein [Terriglobales bacterium]|nr:ATP-binding protein [Terriglobales bacterium]